MNTRKIAVIVLSVMALALMVAAIAIAVQLANNQAPTDTSANISCPIGLTKGLCGSEGTGLACPQGQRQCASSSPDFSGSQCIQDNDCPQPTSTPTPTIVQCKGDGLCSGGSSFCCTNRAVTDQSCAGQGGFRCGSTAQTNPNKCEGSATASACSTANVGDACSGISNATCKNTGTDAVGKTNCGCVLNSTPTPTSGGSTPTPTNTGCGPAGCDGDTRPQCYPYVAGSSQLSIENSDCSVKRTGDSCTQKNSSGTSTGVAGKCQNAPSCSCVANVTPTAVAPVLHACGQHCNQGTGLCAAGFTCAFDNPTCQVNGIYNNTTYCVPNSVYSGLPTCASQYNNSDKYITNSGGSVTEAYILSLCPVGTTGTPLPTDAQGNVIPIPGTAVVSDKLDPILLGLLLVIFGVSLYPRIKFKRPGRTL